MAVSKEVVEGPAERGRGWGGLPRPASSLGHLSRSREFNVGWA